MENRFDRLLIIIFGISITVKSIYLLWGIQDANLPAALSIDELYHYKWAMAISQGDLLTNAPYFRAPFYSYFLAILLKVSSGSLIFVRIIQLALGCLTIGIIFKIGNKMSNKASAVCASLIYLAYPLTTYFEGELLLDSLFTLLSMLVYYFYLRENDIKSALLAGLFFGLAAITRPTILIFLPVIIYGYFKLARREKTDRLNLKPVSVFIMVGLITIAPVTIINNITSNQLIPISYQGGINFYIGNNPGADGVSAILPPFGREWTLEDADYISQNETGEEIKYGAQSRYWLGKGIDYILSHPGQFAKSYFRKLLLFFSGNEISNNVPLGITVFDNKILSKFPVSLVFILGLAIVPLFFDNARKSVMPLYLLIVLFGMAISFFFISSRFRMPVVPLLCIIGGCGISSIYDNFRLGKKISRSVISIVAMLLFIFASSGLSPVTVRRDDNQALYIRGNQSLRAGDYQTAISRFDSLVNINPLFKNGYVNLGIANLKTGNTQEAIRCFDKELLYNPKSSEAANNLAAMHLINQSYDSALYYATMALKEKPYYKEAAVNLLRAVVDVEDESARNMAEETRKTSRRYLYKNPFYLFEEALYLSNLGRISEAINNHLQAIESINEQPRSISFKQAIGDEDFENAKILKLANYQLGYLFGMSGEFNKSIQFSRNAIELDSDFKEAFINLISGYRSLGQNREADSLAEIYIGKWPDN
ncbi:MAG: glycosyltransferase family 39 protein [Candidatus Zixiibacteriota bacterium]